MRRIGAGLPVCLVLLAQLFSCSDNSSDSAIETALSNLENPSTTTSSQSGSSVADENSSDRFNPFASSNVPTAQEALSAEAQKLKQAPPTPPKAKLHVSLTDLAIDAVESLLVTFNRVDVQFTPEGSSEAQLTTISEQERTEDFILLSKGLLKPLGSVEFDRNGTVSQVRLIVKSAQIKFKGETAYKPVTIPSGSETGLKLIGSIPMKLGQQVELVVDYDVERSVTVLGNGNVHMKPTIKVYSIDQAHELGLPEGNKKVYVASQSDLPDPLAPGNPDGRGKRLSQDVKFTTEVRKTGELSGGPPGERAFFTWNVTFSSLQRAAIVREFSDTQELTGTVNASTPDPIPFPITINFNGREGSAGGGLLADGLYIYVVNTAVYLTKPGKEPQGKGNAGGNCGGNSGNGGNGKGKGQGKGQGQGQGQGNCQNDTSTPAATVGQDDMRVIDRDKFYGSARIDNTLPVIVITKPIHKYIFSHDRIDTEVFAKDPIEGEKSRSGLNKSTFRVTITNNEFTNKDITAYLPTFIGSYEAERFASRGPQLLVEMVQSTGIGFITEGGPCNCVREGLNILNARIEDNAENEKNAVTVKFFVDRVKPDLTWEIPPFGSVPPFIDAFITNDGAPNFQVHVTDPMPRGPNTSSGLRKSTSTIFFKNDDTQFTLTRTFADGQGPTLEFQTLETTDPFRENLPSDIVPQIAKLKLTEQPLPDGNYTATASIADRATVVGNTNDESLPPVNIGEATTKFCVDTIPVAINRFDITSPNNLPSAGPTFIPSTVPNVTINCNDKFPPTSPSCGIHTMTLVATKTHDPAPFPGAAPIDIVDQEFRFPLDVALCDDADHTFLRPLSEGRWNFKLEITDKATNSSKEERNSVFLDITQPFTSKILLVSESQGLPLPSNSTIALPTNQRPIRVGVRYSNGLSGINPNSVGFTFSGPGCGGSFGFYAANSNEAVSVGFSPCDTINNGSNVLTVLFQDNAGNQFSDVKSFTADYTPPFINYGSEIIVSGPRPVVGLGFTDGISGVDAGSIVVSMAGVGFSLDLDLPNVTAASNEDVADGTYGIEIRAKDFAGNESVLNSQLIVSTPRPSDQPILVSISPNQPRDIVPGINDPLFGLVIHFEAGDVTQPTTASISSPDIREQQLDETQFILLGVVVHVELAGGGIAPGRTVTIDIPFDLDRYHALSGTPGEVLILRRSAGADHFEPMPSGVIQSLDLTNGLVRFEADSFSEFVVAIVSTPPREYVKGPDKGRPRDFICQGGVYPLAPAGDFDNASHFLMYGNLLGNVDVTGEGDTPADVVTQGTSISVRYMKAGFPPKQASPFEEPWFKPSSTVTHQPLLILPEKR